MWVLSRREGRKPLIKIISISRSDQLVGGSRGTKSRPIRQRMGAAWLQHKTLGSFLEAIITFTINTFSPPSCT